MISESLNESEIAFLQNILMQIKGRRNAMLIGQIVADLSLVFKRHPMQLLEEQLRQINHDSYLISLPMKLEGYTTHLPHTQNIVYPNYLWVCVNGREEAEEKLQEVSLTSDSNFQRLPKTRLLIQKPRVPSQGILQA